MFALGVRQFYVEFRRHGWICNKNGLGGIGIGIFHPQELHMGSSMLALQFPPTRMQRELNKTKPNSKKNAAELRNTERLVERSVLFARPS
jgi:hypothetical protein